MRREATNAPPGRQRIADLLVDHLVGQAELRDLAAHHAAGPRVGVEHGDFVADRGEIARDGQRGGPGADAGDPLAVAFVGGAFGRRSGDVALVVGGDALEPADGDRLLLRRARAGRRARTGGRRCAPECRGTRSTSS